MKQSLKNHLGGIVQYLLIPISERSGAFGKQKYSNIRAEACNLIDSGEMTIKEENDIKKQARKIADDLKAKQAKKKHRTTNSEKMNKHSIWVHKDNAEKALEYFSAENNVLGFDIEQSIEMEENAIQQHGEDSPEHIKQHNDRETLQKKQTSIQKAINALSAAVSALEDLQNHL